MRPFGIVLALLLLMSCAVVGPAPPPPTYCLPATVPADTLTWPIAAGRSMVLLDEQGDPVPAAEIAYQRETVLVVVVWIRGVPAAVDPAPQRSDVPMLLDAGMLTERGTVRTDPEPACRWVAYTPESA